MASKREGAMIPEAPESSGDLELFAHRELTASAGARGPGLEWWIYCPACPLILLPTALRVGPQRVFAWRASASEARRCCSDSW